MDILRAVFYVCPLVQAVFLSSFAFAFFFLLFFHVQLIQKFTPEKVFCLFTDTALLLPSLLIHANLNWISSFWTN